MTEPTTTAKDLPPWLRTVSTVLLVPHLLAHGYRCSRRAGFSRRWAAHFAIGATRDILLNRRVPR